MPLFDCLRSDIGAALGRNLSQLFVACLGILQEAQYEGFQQGMRVELAPSLNDATCLACQSSDFTKDLLQRTTNLGYNVHGKLLLSMTDCA